MIGNTFIEPGQRASGKVGLLEGISVVVTLGAFSEKNPVTLRSRVVGIPPQGYIRTVSKRRDACNE